MKLISVIKDMVWGIPTLLLLFVFGIYFTHKSRFYRFKAFKKTARLTLGSLKSSSQNGISSFSAVATALGGTVGVGSIIGVGYGIDVGGPGSIFWMWVCSFFGMGLKYAEVKISLNKRKTNGGAPYRLKEKGYNKIAVLFCFLCIICSFGTGNLTQIGVMSEVFRSKGISPFVCGGICALIIGIAIFGGRKRIARLNTFIIPLFSGVYLIACLVIIIINLGNLPKAFSDIFLNALGFDSIKGGFSGALLSHVLREGFARSLFSNEAGMGSSPLAHGTAENADSEVQAHWGIFEIFFDTFIVSTITAIALLSCGITDAGEMFSLSFGEIGKTVFGILASVFAFASVISWCYYAECCIAFLFPKGKTADIIYRLLFSLTAFFGAFISANTVWELADILNALMMFPNLFLLFKCRKEIERIT